MKIAVLGAGVIGIASAYYLARAGHEVIVLDRQDGPGLETSFANAGEVSPGYASPWPAPGIPMKALKWLFMRHAPLILRPRFDPAMASWVLAMLRNCTPARYARNKSRMVPLAELSRDELRSLRSDLGLDYDQRTLGTLQLFRTQRQMDDSAKDIAVLEHYGVAFELLDRDGCVRAEPGLAAAREKIAGGLRLPNDETGDCHKFTQALAAWLASYGVKFHYGVNINSLRTANGAVAAACTDQGEIDADVFVAALASYTPRVLRPLGLRLPVYPVKGYSITAPVADAARAPVSTLLDETYKIAVTRLGERIRVGGMAEVSGFSHDRPARRRDTLAFCLNDLFPGAAYTDDLELWSGLRPMTPDGPPIIGPTRFRNLYVNTGHGTLGWTMACGAGRVLADLISGATPAIDIAPLAPARF
ncbi:MAG: D-amino acid dehydrogenase [Alphaproteobacteria bacterium]|nr:MAG: D-amino acid dehydrogenase [Alphaproteobacteria bacterium]